MLGGKQLQEVRQLFYFVIKQTWERIFLKLTDKRLYKHVRNQLGGEVPYLGLLVEREGGDPDT